MAYWIYWFSEVYKVAARTPGAEQMGVLSERLFIQYRKLVQVTDRNDAWALIPFRGKLLVVRNRISAEAHYPVESFFLKCNDLRSGYVARTLSISGLICL